MAYTPKTWADGAAGGTPSTAADLNHLVQGVVGLTGPPSYAGVRTAPFNASLSLYNGSVSSLERIRAKLLPAIAGTGKSTLLALGHSELAGSHATIGTNDVVVDLRKLFAAAGFLVGTGIVHMVNTTGQVIDSRYSAVAAGWAAAGSGVAAPFYQCTTSGAAFTFTSDVAGTVVYIATYGNSAAFTATIDGGTAQAVTLSGTAVAEVHTFTGLANTTHKVVITSTTTGSTYAIGVGVGSPTSLDVENAGLGGSVASDWAPGGSFITAYPTAKASGTNAAIVELDANEALTGVAVGTYKTNMQTILNDLVTTRAIPTLLVLSPSMVPGGGGYAAVSQATWDSFCSAQYDLADQYSLPLLDLTHRYGSWAAANTAGLMADQVHPNGAGYASNAVALARVLIA